MSETLPEPLIRKKKKKKVDGFVIEEEGSHLIHEEYAKEKPRLEW